MRPTRLRRDAYTIEALVTAGICDGATALTLLVDGPAAVPVRPRLDLRTRRRGEPTTRYVWGPDATVLLEERTS